MLRLQNITKVYKENGVDSVTALQDINLVLPKTGLVVLTGSSGCGKTTLLNILGGLDRPTTGELYLDRMRVDDREEAWWDGFRSTTLGFLFQDFNLLENMTVRENIQLPLSLCGLSDEAKEAKVTAVAKELDIQEYLDKKPTKLSGGQKQRNCL